MIETWVRRNRFSLREAACAVRFDRTKFDIANNRRKSDQNSFGAREASPKSDYPSSPRTGQTHFSMKLVYALVTLAPL